MVDLLEHRGPAILQAFDDRELPQRTGAVERSLGERAAQVEQRAAVTAAGVSVVRDGKLLPLARLPREGGAAKSLATLRAMCVRCATCRATFWVRSSRAS